MGNKVEGAAVGALVAVGVLGAIALAVSVSAFPTMLVLGALHSTEALRAVPALGFWETLGSLFVIGSVGRAFRGPDASSSKS
jgi:hypothetical protein